MSSEKTSQPPEFTPGAYHEVVVIPRALLGGAVSGTYHEAVVISRAAVADLPVAVGTYHETVVISREILLRPEAVPPPQPVPQPAVARSEPTPSPHPRPFARHQPPSVVAEIVREPWRTDQLLFASLSGSALLVSLTVVGLLVAQHRSETLKRRLAHLVEQERVEAAQREKEQLAAALAARVRPTPLPLPERDLPVPGPAPAKTTIEMPSEIAKRPLETEHPEGGPGKRDDESPKPEKMASTIGPEKNAATDEITESKKAEGRGKTEKRAVPLDVSSKNRAAMEGRGKRRVAKTGPLNEELPPGRNRPTDDEIVAVRAALRNYFDRWEEIVWWQPLNKTERETLAARERLDTARKAMEPDKRRYDQFLAQDYDKIAETPERVHDSPEFAEYVALRKKMRKHEQEVSILEELVRQLESQPPVYIGRIKYRISGRKGSTTTIDQLYTIVADKAELIDPKQEPKSLHEWRDQFADKAGYRVKAHL